MASVLISDLYGKHLSQHDIAQGLLLTGSICYGLLSTTGINNYLLSFEIDGNNLYEIIDHITHMHDWVSLVKNRPMS